MKLLSIYYDVKPFIPRRIQISLRRAIAARKRKRKKDVWPVHARAAENPKGWNGWPDQKKFALVLNHDVDTIKGLHHCEKLMRIEMQLGLRSSFNFVPEDYPTPSALRKKLTESGFELGVHGLRHDGKHFANQAAFYMRAPRINHYLKEWGTAGFTSPSMLRNFRLMAELNIEHGCSTFDTDPFEPQSDGVETMFPFYVTNDGGTKSYIELPYTLPQDHCIFIILKEKDNHIWKEKLDWVAGNGGMALLNTHPDYMNFGMNRVSFEEYPANFYIDFLVHIKEKYGGEYWHVLPSEMAHFWKKAMPIDWNDLRQKQESAVFTAGARATRQTSSPLARRIKIWLDLDNPSDAPVFVSIIEELKHRGHQIVLTTCGASQVCDLVDRWGIRCTKICRPYSKNMFVKAIRILWHSLQLLAFCVTQRPALAISQGAGAQTVLCNLLRIPTVSLSDYERARATPMGRTKWLIMPEALFGPHFSTKARRLRLYRGFKEDVTVSKFKPNSSLLGHLGSTSDDTLITVWPSPNEEHSENPESNGLLKEFMSRVFQTPSTRVILLPQNHEQEEALRRAHPDWFIHAKAMIPPQGIDGLNLIWFSDLVISGGGIINREAAALGIPVYSLSYGKIAAVDSALEQEGRLTIIRSADEIWNKIQIVRRDKNLASNGNARLAMKDIIENIEDIIRIELE